MFEPRESSEERPSLHRPDHPVDRPVGRFGVSLGDPTPRGLSPARIVAMVGGAAAVAALYVWDDLLLAAPIVAVASVWGPLTAWIIFSTVYSAASFALALLAVGAYDRSRGQEKGKLARWLEAQTSGRRGQWGRRLITSGQVLGFVLASFLLGGIVTTWMTRVVRPDRPVRSTALISCALFGVLFSAQYAGVAALVL